MDFLKKNKSLSLLLGFVVGLILVAIFSPYLAPLNPYETHLKEAFMAPNALNLLGTDKLGRDVLSRVIFGTRVSLLAALVLVSMTLIIGTLLGVIAGYYGGFIDQIIMGISDVMLSFPNMVLAIAISGIMGASILNAVIALTIVSWTKYARLTRSLVIRIKHKEYIQAAKVIGTKNRHILRRHILPNIIPTLIVTATSDIGTMLLELAGLSFLGFGAQAPTAEWGLMLGEGRAYMLQCPWLMVAPGAALCLVVIIFNLLGDHLRDVLDPKSK